MNKEPATLVMPARLVAAIDAELRGATCGSPGFSLILVDVDGMTEVNAAYGHKWGTYFLAAMLRELCAAIPHPAVMSHLGGDEFAIAMPMTGAAQGARRALGVVRRLGRKRVRLGSDHAVSMRVSVGGVSSWMTHDRTPSMLRDAHAALVEAKRHPGMAVVWKW